VQDQSKLKAQGQTVSGVWEERWHPLREEWVIVAAHRQSRPWDGESVSIQSVMQEPSYSKDCYLCPSNTRVHGVRNELYTGIFVFDNDLPCVDEHAPRELPEPPDGPFRNRPAVGKARVVCYSPIHNITLAELSCHEIRSLLVCWQEQYRELSDRPEVTHVLTFENKGRVVGVSNPHPHCQIYATNFVFKTIQTEVDAAAKYWNSCRRVLFEDIIRGEMTDGRRIVADCDSVVGFVPYFARYAYETYIAPKQPYQNIADLSANELTDFASALKQVLVRYDNLWNISFPYVLVLHQAPTDGRIAEGFHFHVEIHPPQRSLSLFKYLAGPEIGGGSFLSDTSPEEKAAELVAAPATHYKVKNKSSQ
jgi:UDPglucose--hexose-1-phosphate uridylyltransferase